MVFHVEADADAVVVNLVRREEMDIKTQLIGLAYEPLGWEGGEQRRRGRGRNAAASPRTPQPELLFDVMHPAPPPHPPPRHVTRPQCATGELQLSPITVTRLRKSQSLSVMKLHTHSQ